MNKSKVKSEQAREDVKEKGKQSAVEEEDPAPCFHPHLHLSISCSTCRMPSHCQEEFFYLVQVVLIPSINNLHMLLASQACPFCHAVISDLQGRNLSASIMQLAAASQ